MTFAASRLGAIGTLLLAVAATPQTGWAQSPDKPAADAANPATPPVNLDALALARDIIAADIAEKDRSAVFEGVINLVRSGAAAEIPYAPFDKEPGLNAIYKRYDAALRARLDALIAARIPAMYEHLAIAYAQEFSMNELRDIRTFMASSSGRGFLSRSNATMANPAILQFYETVLEEGRRIADPMTESLRNELEEYGEKHPEAVQRFMDSQDK